MKKSSSMLLLVTLIGVTVTAPTNVCWATSFLDENYNDDFSVNSELWTLLGSAYRDSGNQCLVLTTPENGRGGVAFFQVPFRGPFTANFSYKVGGGWGGDGFTIFFYKQNYSTIDGGGSLGFSADTEAVPGYGIEFDGWQNIDGGYPSPPKEAGDPSGNHIALIKDWYGNHLVHVDDFRTEDFVWHNVSVVVGTSVVGVFVDDEIILRWDGALDMTYDMFGFSAGTGDVTNWHLIDNFYLTTSITELPPTPTRPNISGPMPKPPLTSTLISISANASSTEVGSTVNINGKLTDKNGTSLVGKTVILSYSVGNTQSWFPIGSGETNALGEYRIQWVPEASGTFMLRTEWGGDENHTGTYNSTTLCLLPYQSQYVFSIESNSSVTELEFNDANGTLSFAVSGPNGTAGYTRVTIAKTLISDITDIVAYVDGRILNFTASESNDGWTLIFIYSHSTHNISINLTRQENKLATTTTTNPAPLPTITPTSEPIPAISESVEFSPPTNAPSEPLPTMTTESVPLLWLTLIAVAVSVAAIGALVCKKRQSSKKIK